MPVSSAERSEFIESNLGLVHACAGRFKGRGIEYEELYASGCVGLIKAWLSGGQQDSPEHMARLIHRVITRYLASNAPELY